MPLHVRCPCGASYRVAASSAGTRFRCSGCGKKMRVPPAAVESQPATEPAPLGKAARPRIRLAVAAGLLLLGGAVWWLATDRGLPASAPRPQAPTAARPPAQTEARVPPTAREPAPPASNPGGPGERPAPLAPPVAKAPPRERPPGPPEPVVDITAFQIVRAEPAAPEQGGSLTLVLDGADRTGQPVTYHYRTDPAGPWQPAQGSRVVLADLKPGPLRIEVQAKNRLGGVSRILTHAVTVAKVGPLAVTIAAVEPPQPRSRGPFVISLAGTGFSPGPLSYQFRVGGQGDWRDAPAGRVTLSDLKPGALRVEFRASDGRGRTAPVLAESWAVRDANELEGHANGVRCLAFSPDSRLLVSGGADKTVRLWDVATGVEVCRFVGHEAEPVAVAFTPDGRQVISVSGNTRASVPHGEWVKKKNGKRVWELGEWVYKGRERVWQPGEWLPVDCTIRFWDVATGKELRRVAGPARHLWTGGTVAISPDGRHVLYGHGADAPLLLWDTETGKAARWFRPRHGGCAPRVVAFSADGRLAVGAGRPLREDGYGGLERDDKRMAVAVWDVATGEELCTCTAGVGKEVHSVALSPDGRSIIAGCGDHKIRRWDRYTRRQIYCVDWKGCDPLCLAFLPDGSRFTCGHNDTHVRLWGTEDGKELARLERHKMPVTAVAASPDGRWVASGSATMTYLWAVEADKAPPTGGDKKP